MFTQVLTLLLVLCLLANAQEGGTGSNGEGEKLLLTSQ